MTRKLTSAFARVLTVITKNWFLEGSLGTSMCLYPILRFSFYFLISWNPKFQVVLQLENQLVFNIFYTRYQVPSHLRQNKLARKHSKLPKYYTDDCKPKWFVWVHLGNIRVSKNSFSFFFVDRFFSKFWVNSLFRLFLND